MAGLIGARHLIIESNELEIPGYAQNPLNRCYLCKHNLFTVCEAKARELQSEDLSTASILTTCTTIGRGSRRPPSCACAIRWSKQN